MNEISTGYILSSSSSLILALLSPLESRNKIDYSEILKAIKRAPRRFLIGHRDMYPLMSKSDINLY